MRVPAVAAAAGFGLLLLGGCLEPVPSVPQQECPATLLADVADCLLADGAISPAQHDHAVAISLEAGGLRDSITAAGGTFASSTEITLATARILDFYQRGLLADSARFNRLVDHLAVTMDYLRGNGSYRGSTTFAPASEPYLLWHYYAGLGMQFQPVTTEQAVTSITPRLSVPTDSILQVAQRLYDYAVRIDSPEGRLPFWEYDFYWAAGGVSVAPPWRSGMAQGLALVLFTDAWQRTQDPLWRQRTFEVFRSMQVSWADGGIRLADTTHGYWWLEFHPTVRVWNGAVQALVGITYFAQATQDSAAVHAMERGIEAVKYYTPLYDTGSWTHYALTQGNNSVGYHTFHVQLLDRMYTLTGDQWFKTTADRWRAYVPPPGVH